MAKKPVKKTTKKEPAKTESVAVAVAEPTVPLPPVEPENHNGHDKLTHDQLREIAPTLGEDHFGKAFTTQRTSSAIEKLVERGDDEREFWLRGNYKDPNHLNSCAILLMLADHYKDKELKELVFNHMAGYPAIGEGRIQDLVKAIIGDMESRKKLNPFGLNNIWSNITGSKNGAGDKSGQG